MKFEDTVALVKLLVTAIAITVLTLILYWMGAPLWMAFSVSIIFDRLSNITIAIGERK